MQRVISNSSVLIHLAKINELALLKEYYQTIIIPAKVQKECIFEGEDRKEVALIKGADWINVEDAKDHNLGEQNGVRLDY